MACNFCKKDKVKMAVQYRAYNKDDGVHNNFISLFCSTGCLKRFFKDEANKRDIVFVQLSIDDFLTLIGEE